MDEGWSVGRPPFELRASESLRVLSLRDVDVCEDVSYLEWIGKECLRDFTLIAPLGPPDSWVPAWKDRAEYEFVFSAVEEFTELEHLCVGSWMQFGSAGLLSVLQAATMMPKLKSLTIPACYSRFSEQDRPVFVQLMANLFSNCKQLQSLRLLFNGIPTANLEAWTRNFGILQDLALNAVPLSGALPNLKSLRLFSSNGPPLSSLDWGSQFPLLESLHLVKDDNFALLVSDNPSQSFTGESKKFLSIARLEHLRNLSLVLSPDVISLLGVFHSGGRSLDYLHIQEDHPDVHVGGFSLVKNLPTVRKSLRLTVSRIYQGYKDSRPSEEAVLALVKKSHAPQIQIDGILLDSSMQALNAIALKNAGRANISLHTLISKKPPRENMDATFNGFFGLQFTMGGSHPSRETEWLQRCDRLRYLCFIVQDEDVEDFVADLKRSLPLCKISVKRWVEYYLH